MCRGEKWVHSCVYRCYRRAFAAKGAPLINRALSLLVFAMSPPQQQQNIGTLFIISSIRLFRTTHQRIARPSGAAPTQTTVSKDPHGSRAVVVHHEAAWR